MIPRTILILLILLNSAFVLGQSDSIEYRGYRLSIFQLENILDTPQKKKWIISLANTGKFGVPLYPEKAMEKYTLFKTSTKELEKRLNENFELIISSLKNSRQTLASGKYISALTLEWNRDAEKKKNSVKGNNQEISGIGSSPNAEPVTPFKEECSDLIIEELKVLKKTKKKIELSYTISNRGEDKAKIFDASGDRNLAVKAYISGTPAISRGTTVLGGAYLDRNENMSDELGAGDSIKGKLEFKIEEVSRYTPVLVLEVDVFNLVSECDEGNNTKFVMLP